MTVVLPNPNPPLPAWHGMRLCTACRQVTAQPDLCPVCQRKATP